MFEVKKGDIVEGVVPRFNMLASEDVKFVGIVQEIKGEEVTVELYEKPKMLANNKINVRVEHINKIRNRKSYQREY